MADSIQRAEMHHRVKFHRSRSIRCRNIAMFRFLKMATAVILDFGQYKLPNSWLLTATYCALQVAWTALCCDSAGWQTWECNRLVSQSSWLRMLAVGNRCWNSNAKPAVSGAICCNCGMIVLMLYFFLERSFIICNCCLRLYSSIFCMPLTSKETLCSVYCEFWNGK